MAKLHVVHERPDQENAPAGSPQQILRRQRVRQTVEIETLALVRDHYREALRAVRQRKPYLLIRVIPVAVSDGVYHRLPYGHTDSHQIVFIEPRAAGGPRSQFFGLI